MSVLFKLVYLCLLLYVVCICLFGEYVHVCVQCISGKPLCVRLAVIVGGREMVAQSLDMNRRPHVLIATPGRLCDHIESGTEVGFVFTALHKCPDG